MKKIPKVLSNTRVSEVNGLSSQITDEYQKKDYSADIYLTGLFDQLINKNNELGVALMRDKTESELAELDAVADGEFTKTHGLSKGYTYHPDETIASAAQKLFKLIDKYGLEVKYKGYLEEYPLIKSLLTESKANEYVQCINALPGCDVRFERLEKAVDNFTTKQSAYNAAKDDEKELESASVIKKQVLDLINDDIVPYLNAMQKAHTDVYESLAQFTANRISESNAAVRNRNKKDEE